MAAIDSFVEVNITRQTAQIDITSFSVPMLLTTHDAFTERARVYGSLEGVGADFDTASATYIMASKVFGQQLKPATIVIGRRDELETYPAALVAVQAENDDWYAVAIDSHVKADILAMANTIQGMTKLFFAATADADVISAVATDDVGSALYNGNYDRTSLVYSPTADTDYPEAAWLWQLVETPGSNTWALKTLAGVTVTNLTETAVGVLNDKKVNYFRRVKGAAIIMNGCVASGEWIDTMIFLDWLKARLQEAIFYRMINSKKIPFDTSGVAIIENEIRSVLTLGVTNGGIATTPAYTVISPSVLAVPETQRAQRILGDFLFTARLAGAVHKVVVRGTVSY